MKHTPRPTSKLHILRRWRLMNGPYHFHVVAVVIIAAAMLVGGVFTGQRLPADPASPLLAYKPCAVAEQGAVDYLSTGQRINTDHYAQLTSQFSGKVAVLGSTAFTTWFSTDGPPEVVQSIYLLVPFGAVPPRAGVSGDLIATKPGSPETGFSIWAVVRTIKTDDGRYATMEEVSAHPEWLQPTDYAYEAFTAFQCPVL